MDILFAHQNFPGQFRHSASALAADKANRVLALGINPQGYPTPGVAYGRYPIRRKPAEVAPLLMDFQSKLIRGEAAAAAAVALRDKGFEPDVIVVHPGWGEQMFLKDVWPKARMLSPSWSSTTGPKGSIRISIPSSSPTRSPRGRAPGSRTPTTFSRSKARTGATARPSGSASSLPTAYLPKTSVIFDGIDTDFITPDPAAVFRLPDGREVKAGDEVLTFVNRNLEPYPRLPCLHAHAAGHPEGASRARSR